MQILFEHLKKAYFLSVDDKSVIHFSVSVLYMYLFCSAQTPKKRSELA